MASRSAKAYAGAHRSLTGKEAGYVHSALHTHSRLTPGTAKRVVDHLKQGRAHDLRAGHLGEAIRATQAAAKDTPNDSPRATTAKRASAKMAALSYPVLGMGHSSEPGTYEPANMPLGGS